MLSNGSKVPRYLRVACLFFAICSLHASTQAAYFDGCDYTYNIKAGHSYLKSPPYQPNISCRYKYVAPIGHDIMVDCTISLAEGPNGCTTDRFYVARDGDLKLRDAEQFCSFQKFKRKSIFRSLVVAYIAGSSQSSFRCQLYARPQQRDCGWSINTKIVNGKEASVNEYPSIAALRDRKTGEPLYCAAVIISLRYLLTAAHCVDFQPNPAYIEAHVGRHNINSTDDTKYSAVYNISKIIKHPMYTRDPFENDIALMKTARDIEFSKGVGPICLPPLSYAKNNFSNDDVDVIGWGTITFGGPRSPTLQKVYLKAADYQTCIERYKDVTPTDICTYDDTGTGKDACQGDSGGPIIFNNNRQFLVGIIGYGTSCGENAPTIAVNTRVTSYLQWIYANIES